MWDNTSSHTDLNFFDFILPERVFLEIVIQFIKCLSMSNTQF